MRLVVFFIGGIMYSWESLYKKNKELDEIFFARSENVNKFYEKNCIEFLVELGEFINETKCFKFWSIKEPIKENMLEELGDCFTMIMVFYNLKNIPFEPNNISIEDNGNLLELINTTYFLGTKLYTECDKELLNTLFNKLLNIASILNINENEIKNSIHLVHKKIENRLNSEY